MGPVAQQVFKTCAVWQPHARSVRLRRRSVTSIAASDRPRGASSVGRRRGARAARSEPPDTTTDCGPNVAQRIAVLRAKSPAARPRVTEAQGRLPSISGVRERAAALRCGRWVRRSVRSGITHSAAGPGRPRFEADVTLSRRRRRQWGESLPRWLRRTRARQFRLHRRTMR
jgi:hypothetical protein